MKPIDRHDLPNMDHNGNPDAGLKNLIGWVGTNWAHIIIQTFI